MVHRIADRAQDTTTTYSGTGNFTLANSAPTGYQSPKAVCTVDGDTIDLLIVGGSQWEYTRCTRVSDGVFSRANPPYASSSGSQISFTSGVKEVMGDVGAFFAEHLNTVEISITSAATLDIGALKGKFAVISGTTGPTTSLGTGANKERIVRHSGSTWTCNTTSMILLDLPNGASRVNTVNAISILKSDASGNWRELMYRPPTAPETLAKRNLIDNPFFAICQRTNGAATAKTLADNAFGPDRWRYIGENTANVEAADFSIPGLGPLASGLTAAGTVVFTTANGKGGFFQVLHSQDCKWLRGATVTLDFYSLVNNARIGDIRAGILEWTGTADAVTGDPISAWNAAGTNPTLAANWAFKNTPANLSVGTGAAKVASITVTLGTTFNNLAVMIWNDDKVYDANDFFRVSSVKLQYGDVASPIERESMQAMLERCQRFLPVFNASGGGGEAIGFGGSFNTTTGFVTVAFHVATWTRPTGVVVSSAGHFSVFDTKAVATTALTSLTYNTSHHDVGGLLLGVASGLTAGCAVALTCTNVSGQIIFTGAEI